MLPNYLVRKGNCFLAKAKRMTKENLKKNAVKSFLYLSKSTRCYFNIIVLDPYFLADCGID